MEDNENKIVRGTVDMDYVPLESIVDNKNNEVFPNQTQQNVEEEINNNSTQNMVTSQTSESTISRNELNIGFVDLENKQDETETISQEELDENINSETKVNEAGKKEVRIEVDPVVTNTHKKDDKIKKMISFSILLIVIVIGIILFFNGKDNRQEVFYRNIKSAASSYINDSLNQSTLSQLYLEKTDKITISVKELYNKGYYDGKLTDPKTKEDVSETLVKIYLKDGKLEFEYPYEK